MICEILAFIDDADTGAPFLRALLARAAKLEACTKVHLLTPPSLLPPYAPLYPFYLPETPVLPDPAVGLDQVRALVAGAGDHVEVHGVPGSIGILSADGRGLLRVADLIVIGHETTWHQGWLRRRLTETLILSAGTPLLLTPETSAFGPVRHAVFGWKPSAQSNRALHDLVALAEPGARIDVVTIAGGSESEADADARAGIVTHLVRHGFAAESRRFDDGGADVDQLRAFSVQQHADLLAVGGFAHSRVREIILGGVTRGLIEDPIIPILMAH